jgi:hypothetical protein
MAGGNLIQYKGNLSTHTADITSKILWNSVLCTKNAKYMCLDIKNFYLTAALEYFEYMKIPLSLFPVWKWEQMLTPTRDLSTSIWSMQCRASPKQGSWPTNCSKSG